MSRGLIVLVAASATATVASAQVDEEALQLMRETTSYTDVADAADGEDPFDAYLRVGFLQERTTGAIRRESNDASGIPGFTKVGDYEHVRSILEVGVDVGVYHDLSFNLRLPVILSDTQTISGSGTVQGTYVPPGGTATTEDLFTLPFESPTRSGIDTIHLGFSWSPLNQNRVHEVPTWVIIADVGLPVGSVMNPCEAGDSTCSPGISRGNVITRFETRISRRHRYAEPYFGFIAQAELPTASRSDFRPNGKLAGYQNRLPPVLGTIELGTAFVPWENLPRHQRLTVDARFMASYIANGHDFGPLYDALGSSQATGLTTPNCEDGGVYDDGDPSTPICSGLMDPLSIPFNGLTDTLAYVRTGFRLAVEVQAAKYVSFSLGGSFQMQTPYSITSADVCNASEPSIDTSANRPTAIDCVSGIFNPHFRGIIDEPGQRFELARSTRVDLFARATAMF